MNYICPICQKQTIKLHYRTCGKNISKEKLKELSFKETFPLLFNDDGKLLKKEYIEDGLSGADLCKKYNISSKIFYYILDYFNIKHKSVKESTNLPYVREKYSNTCLEKYGGTNALSKGTDPYKKKQTTVLEKYGVDNVRKSEIIKEKITKTMLELYGVKRKYNINNLKDYSIKNKLESKIAEALTMLDISYTFSFFMGRKQYDFNLGNKILLEIQGDYWHANPLKYNEDDIISHHGGKKKVKDIWQKDKDKKQYAEEKGYSVFYLWEHDINQCSTQKELHELIMSLFC